MTIIRPLLHAGCGVGAYAPLTQCTEFDGTEYILGQAYAQIEFQPSDTFTVGCWFKSSTAATSAEAFITARDWAAAHGWDLFRAAGEGILFSMQKDSSNYYIKRSTQNTADGNWHQLVAVHRGTGDVSGIDLYVDGAPATGISTTVSGTVGSITYTSDPIEIGRRGSGQPNPLIQGRMCHTYALDVALTAAQVECAHSLGVPVMLDTIPGVAAGNVVHHFRLGQGDTVGANNVIDQSPLGKDATPSGGMVAGDFQIADVPP